MLAYQIHEEKNKLFVELEGDLDIESTEIINNELLPRFLQHETVVIDFATVGFVDSSGMGLLIQIVKQMKEKDQQIQIIHVKEDILEVFDMVQMHEIIGNDVIV
ncbi:anti-sigmaB factor antagonist [Gracilibacillus halophilus YIM-C55.5]|uniref:Anti-sigma factor antagonist n=1 Tax=Gracilibacillus halophilus YIM-C55.5 TaxID=1308866 RepID=N4WD31_9BACI|nr:STAS domain-containing protein [Gracilibacillus halophilus]ENH97149.1 anti-sigmaB factor antagonist [Gracilibacillus halophilus YIM-C55.5]